MTFTVCQSGEREVLGVTYWIGALSLAAALAVQTLLCG